MSIIEQRIAAVTSATIRLFDQLSALNQLRAQVRKASHPGRRRRVRALDVEHAEALAPAADLRR